MSSTSYILIILIILMALTEEKKRKNWLAKYLKLKQGKENHIMKEAVSKFIDRKCLIYLLNGEVKGIIREVSDDSLLIETKDGSQIINLNFVMRIREYHKK